jgi:hypothetical protein
MTQKNRNVNRNDAGAAEVIGFIYIFGIVIISMSLILVMGYPMLQSSMDDSIFESAEQSFIILQTNMKMVAFDQVPVKTMSIQLQSSTLSINQNSNITVSDTSGTYLYGEGEIEFQKNDKLITYENGGIWKKYPSGNIMVSKPRIFSNIINGNKITTIGIVSIITENEKSSMGGRGIATLDMRYASSNLSTPSNKVDVKISINSTYANQTGSYLKSIGFDIDEANSTPSHLTATRNDTLLVIGMHTVNVTII